MKIKKNILIILLIMALCVLVIIGCVYGMREYSITKANDKYEEHISESSEESIDKERLFKFAENILEETYRGKVALIDSRMTLLEADGHDRYLVKVESVGVNSKEKIDLYHYYMILQRTAQDELYMMPFGLESLVGEVEQIKEDVLISMLKVTNSWEMSQSEVLDKWNKSMENTYYNNLKQATEEINNMYYLQSLICFVNDYIYKNGENAFLPIGGDSVERELIDFAVREVKNREMQEENIVTVVGKLRVYGKEWIKDYKVEMMYTIEMDEQGNFNIEEQKGFIR
ncbi:hypothetical protein PBV87_04280 [Niameybacter massiliensis]|uniref:Uncharacterized protein n=1 Tax=Holtiella tumoricola TaxID=3018743 RepID=A0AA42DKL5_9FIRM|nr:hypothetical protein [Holtiella tumoricola]MDA3730717.1 hypothetical protein [Holtiella tumoricola]